MEAESCGWAINPILDPGRAFSPQAFLAQQLRKMVGPTGFEPATS